MERKEKTYRAIRHDIVRLKQKQVTLDLHHPNEKVQQIQEILQGLTGLNILELFAGSGNCTTYYDYMAKSVKAYELNKEKFSLLSENIKSVWRYAFKVTKIKATDYTGVVNR